MGHQTMRMLLDLDPRLAVVSLRNFEPLDDTRTALVSVFRAALSTAQILHATLQLIRNIGWHRVVLVAPYDAVGLQARRVLRENLDLEGVEMNYESGERAFAGFDDAAVAESRIFVVAASQRRDLFAIIFAAYTRGLFTSEFVWLFLVFVCCFYWFFFFYSHLSFPSGSSGMFSFSRCYIYLNRSIETRGRQIWRQQPWRKV
jgi:hypothetical protein